MLWITGGICLAVWFILKFVFHKGGFIHIVLVSAITLFVIQFVQDRRTAEYKRSLKR
jgi:hypothetical protein